MTSINNRMQVRVINLDRSPERLARIAGELDAAGLRFDRYAARNMGGVDLATISHYDAGRAKSRLGRELSRGEVGCFMSHMAVLEEFVASSADVLMVLEDDTHVPASTKTFAATLLGHLDEYGEDGWHCVNLALSYPKRRMQVAEIAGHTLFRAFFFPVYNSALIWSRSGARSFIDWVAQNGIWMPVDHATRHVFVRTGKGFMIEPSFMPQRDDGSEIGDSFRNEGRERRGLQSIVKRIPLYLWAFYQALVYRDGR